MHAFVEVLGPGSHDASSSVQLFFDESRYLFECGDGTQRLCTEYGVKLGRLRGVYLTSLAAPSTGGLLGLVLTVADAGKEQVTIAAPKGIKGIFRAAKTFFYRPTLNSTLKEIDVEAPHDAPPVVLREDENVTIEAVPIRCRRDIEMDTGFGAHYDAVSYVCKLRDIRGKFNPKRAMELGVQKGRKFGFLQRGESVKSETGSVVNPSDVMSPSTPGPVLVVLACPSLDHVQSVVCARSLDPTEVGVMSTESGSLTPTKRRCVVIHLAPKEVLEDSVYQAWCDSFGSQTCHIPLHPSVAPRRTVFSSQAEGLTMLHHSIDRDIFPIPSDAFSPISHNSVSGTDLAYSDRTPTTSATPNTGQATEEECESSNKRMGQWVDGDCRLRYILSPIANAGPDRSAVRPRFVEQTSDYPCFPWRDTPSPSIDEQEPAGTEMKTPTCISSLSPGTAAVRFLGTGGAIPAKYRNVSGVLLDLFERGSVLFDCGEGTWGQMVRHFGVEKAKRVLCGLKVVFISHMHADHHLGLTTLLHQRTAAIRENAEFQDGPQLVIIGPHHLAVWLGAFQVAVKVPPRDKLSPGKRSYKFCDAASLKDPQAPESKFFSDAFGLELGCVDVVHCPHSYGVVVRDCVHGWKVVYSGDTRPCDALAEIGKGATLAIHEATLDDDKLAEAKEKFHCTTSEALDICGGKMQAWRTILTHFSQRYPRIPRLDDATLRNLHRNRAGVAFDLMSVDFTRLEELPRMVPALPQAFPDETVDESVTEPNCVAAVPSL